MPDIYIYIWHVKYFSHNFLTLSLFLNQYLYIFILESEILISIKAYTSRKFRFGLLAHAEL